ncbi:MAG: amino acid ABC transporter permease [Eubacteriales bacterium]
MSFFQVTAELMDGFWLTCRLFAETLLYSLPLGLLISFGLLSNFRPLRGVMNVVVWAIRGTPLMLLLFIVFYVPGFAFGVTLDRYPAALLAFVVNYACYFAVIFKGGIQSVPVGQTEAGQVLGMRGGQVFGRVVLFQVFRNILAPVSNEVITLVKDTALARTISVLEIMFMANQLLTTKALVWPLFYTALFYLLFIGVLTLLFQFLEKKVSYYKV